MKVRRNFLTLPALAFLVLVALLAPVAVRAAEPEAPAVGIEAFFGSYEGRGSGSAGSHATDRDLAVSIGPAGDKGFVVSWSTAVRGKAGEAESRKAYSIGFQPTQRPGVYSSAMRANVFGDKVPMDPFKGDPFVWARLSGKTLSVYALIILDDGGYDLQIYDRTLTPSGLDLVFSRWVDRQQVGGLSAQLVRKGG
ncbi:MAG: hypothetical protein U0S49_07880 [Rhodospirillales bacterium]|nr:hypothetical protein [Rhodospirillales bacterium]